MLELAVPVVSVLSGISFLFYGALCVFSRKMEVEFERYRLARFRRLVGFLEFGGGLGQLIGLYSPTLAILSSGGLALLMLCGIWARQRIQDPWYLFLPAIILFLVNAALFIQTIL
jgi:uncharacterized membrane protein YphA (DoxX/SURF4 family)